MSKRANPKLIGAFVVGAVALVVVGVLVLGSLQGLFERPVRVVMLFDGDVNGLTVGAPIAFRGVNLGHVSDIRIKVGSGGRIAVYGEFPPRVLDEDAVTMLRGPLRGPPGAARDTEPVDRAALRQPEADAGHPCQAGGHGSQRH